MDVKKFLLSYYKDATQDFHITRITRPQGALELHQHPYFQLYYVVRGSMIHHVDDSLATLGAGDVFILPPELPHRIEALGQDVDFYSMSFTPPGIFRAAGDIRYPLVLSVSTMILFRVGLSYLLCLGFHMGLMGVWLGMAADWLCRTILNTIHFCSGKWLDKKLI